MPSSQKKIETVSTLLPTGGIRQFNQMEKPTYLLKLEALPGKVDANVRLRQALKVLLRAFGLRCREVREVKPEGKPDATT